MSKVAKLASRAKAPVPTTAMIKRRSAVKKWPPQAPHGPHLAHSLLRQYEQIFDRVVYFRGVLWFPWKYLANKFRWGGTGMVSVIYAHFHGEYLLVQEDGSICLNQTNGSHRDIPSSLSDFVFLRLSYALGDQRANEVILNMWKIHEQENRRQAMLSDGPIMEYVQWTGPFVKGLFYGRPPNGACGIYVEHASSTFEFSFCLFDGEFFVAKAGKGSNMSGRQDRHGSSTSDVGPKGDVMPLFGIEVELHELKLCSLRS